jgi:hypothetical protein
LEAGKVRLRALPLTNINAEPSDIVHLSYRRWSGRISVPLCLGCHDLRVWKGRKPDPIANFPRLQAAAHRQPFFSAAASAPVLGGPSGGTHPSKATIL